MSEIYEALYAYNPQSPEDMQFNQGDQIELIEKLSPDWSRGKNQTTGAVGVFPMNYVQLSNAGGTSEKFARPAAPVPGNNFVNSPQPYDQNEKYQPPPPSWQASQQQYQQPQYQAPQPYYPPQQQQYQPPMQYQQPQQSYPESVMMPQQQQPQQQKKHKFGGLAKRFGDSVVFGAGATLGGDLINKLF